MVPPSAESSSFDEAIYRNAVLYVPKGSVTDYKNTNPWSNFYNIKISDIAGIGENIFEKENKVDIYNLSGTPVMKNASTSDIKNLPYGIYIINGKKILIK